MYLMGVFGLFDHLLDQQADACLDFLERHGSLLRCREIRLHPSAGGRYGAVGRQLSMREMICAV
jgi:hypothetical protein